MPQLPAGGGSPVAIGTGIIDPEGLAIDAGGNVYVSDLGDGTVKKIQVSDGSTVTLASGFSFPRGIAVDAADNAACHRDG